MSSTFLSREWIRTHTRRIIEQFIQANEKQIKISNNAFGIAFVHRFRSLCKELEEECVYERGIREIDWNYAKTTRVTMPM